MLPALPPRATEIVRQILERECLADLIPAGPPGTFAARTIQINEASRAVIGEGFRKVVGRLSGEIFGARLLPDHDWRHIEVFVRGKRVLAANVKGAVVELFFFAPGSWELDYGFETSIDYGFDAVSPPRRGTAAWAAFVADADHTLPPRGPSSQDLASAGNHARRRSRCKAGKL